MLWQFTKFAQTKNTWKYMAMLSPLKKNYFKNVEIELIW